MASPEADVSTAKCFRIGDVVAPPAAVQKVRTDRIYFRMTALSTRDIDLVGTGREDRLLRLMKQKGLHMIEMSLRLDELVWHIYTSPVGISGAYRVKQVDVIGFVDQIAIFLVARVLRKARSALLRNLVTGLSEAKHYLAHSVKLFQAHD